MCSTIRYAYFTHSRKVLWKLVGTFFVKQKRQTKYQGMLRSSLGCGIAHTLLKLRALISVHIIGCRKTKLSMERKMFPVCGPRKYICISVVFRHFRNFPEVFRRFPDISIGFLEISGGFPNENIKE
jgi:hypothetical protein